MDDIGVNFITNESFNESVNSLREFRDKVRSQMDNTIKCNECLKNNTLDYIVFINPLSNVKWCGYCCHNIAAKHKRKFYCNKPGCHSKCQHNQPNPEMNKFGYVHKFCRNHMSK